MHILFLTPEYPHETTGASGGLGTSIKNLVLALVDKGIDVTVVVPYQDETEIIRENSWTLYKIAKKSFSFANWFFYKRHVGKLINQYCEKNLVDVIEVPDWTGITAFMNLKTTICARFNGSDAYFCKLDGREQSRHNFMLEKLNLRNASHYVSASAFTAQLTRDIFKLQKPITTIHNSINTDLFKPILNSQPDEMTILYYGTIIRKKGVFDLMKMFNLIVEMHPTVKLLFVGKDSIDVVKSQSTIELLKEIASSKAQSRLSFIQEVPYKEVQDYIASATVITLPSYAEALPMTWIESMAMEKALVTSNIGWAKEVMVDKETGFTVSPSNYQEYADKVLNLLSDQELREEFGKQARQRVKEVFAADVIVNQNIDFYQSIVNKLS